MEAKSFRVALVGVKELGLPFVLTFLPLQALHVVKNRLGMSRDSVMANHVYEYYKNKVIKTMVGHIADSDYTQNDMTCLCILILKNQA